MTGSSLDINATFRGGGRAVEFLDQINQASIVMLAETGIVPKDVAQHIARGIAQVIKDERTGKLEPRASADYLDYEPRLIAAAVEGGIPRGDQCGNHGVWEAGNGRPTGQ